jgi:hypothetical protein
MPDSPRTGAASGRVASTAALLTAPTECRSPLTRPTSGIKSAPELTTSLALPERIGAGGEEDEGAGSGPSGVLTDGCGEAGTGGSCGTATSGTSTTTTPGTSS